LKSFLIALVLGAIVSSTEAATTTAEVVIAWDTLVIDTTGTVAISLTETFVNNTARAFDTNLNTLDVTASLLGPTTVTVPGAGFATAGDPGGPFAFASADFGVLDAASQQGDVYSISGTGAVTASVDFSIVLDEPIGQLRGNFGGANLFIEFYEFAGSPFTSVAVADTVDLFAFVGTGSQMLTGTLTATVEIPSTNELSAMVVFGETGAAASVVPVPAAIWLFGSALGLLGWIRRRWPT
jgi:hypothetical protein